MQLNWIAIMLSQKPRTFYQKSNREELIYKIKSHKFIFSGLKKKLQYTERTFDIRLDKDQFG